ncbi:MAG: DUF418 domain-containing protein [Chitinophagaceae bacterium]
MNETSQPVSLNERIQIIDVVRGLAICGILVGNMQWFSGYGMMPQSLISNNFTDKVVHFLVHVFVEGKFYSIFSFLFGFGFALQISHAKERGDYKVLYFKRRLFWLLVIGLLHAYLLWAGDILSIYALMGFLLILFRKKSKRSLLRWSLVLIIIPILSYLLLFILFAAFVPGETIAKIEAGRIDMWNSAVIKVGQGNYWQIIADFNLDYIAGRYAGLIFEMRLPKILAMFLLGFYACRRELFNDTAYNRAFISKVLIYGLITGVTGNIVFTAVAGSEATFPPSVNGIIGVISYALGVPAMALFYIAVLTTAWQKRSGRRVLAFLGPVGKMALTNYLMQTIICVLIFYGFGLGQFGKWGAGVSTLTAFLIFTLQILVSRWWLNYFNYGPVEWLWRKLTYRQPLKFRRS